MHGKTIKPGHRASRKQPTVVSGSPSVGSPAAPPGRALPVRAQNNDGYHPPSTDSASAPASGGPRPSDQRYSDPFGGSPGELDHATARNAVSAIFDIVAKGFRSQSSAEDARFRLRTASELSPGEVLSKTSPRLRAKLLHTVSEMASKPFLSEWNTLGVQEMLELGATPQEVRSLVEKTLEPVLDVGRRAGLSAQEAPRYSIPSDSGVLGFWPTYLSPFSKAATAFQTRPPFDESSYPLGALGYQVDLEPAYSLARTVGDKPRIQEIFNQALALGAYNQARRIAEGNGDEGQLLTVAMLALNQHYEENASFDPSNELTDAIRALDSVRGAQRPEAKRMLISLAKFLAKAPGGARDADAMRALRASGAAASLHHFDSVRTEYNTRLDDPGAAQLMRDLVSRSTNIDPEDIRRSLVSLGDPQEITRQAQRYIQKGRYADAAELMLAAGEPMAAERALAAWKATGKADTFELSVVEPMIVAALGGKTALIAAGNSAQQEGNTELAKAFRDAVKHGPSLLEHDENLQTPARAAEPLSSLGNEVRELQSFIKSVVLEETGSNADLKAALSIGRAALKKKDSFGAYQAFLRAGDVHGIEAAADLAVAQGDAINAVAPYLAAALLRAP
jgi:hypothetical protein